ncbi:MAG: pyrimidine-nucleoside phosphorylase [Anaerolineae bacterium]|nr:MAG: pyrimidine-nucleoside phosphorylase [Anaerolineae bacterium]
MRATEIIEKKRDGLELSTEEIRWFIQGFTKGEIPDYQAAAWLMAVFLRGMSKRETLDLTLAMAESGEQLDLSSVIEYAVDKHSTGGVGDKVTLVVAPLVAAAGVPVAKMSGRGLGFSGGTIDKLESISGYRVALSEEEIVRQVREHGIVLCGQTRSLAPADGALYALRDVTGTVPSLPLIASSIMSKKLASGARAIVLDVKVGAGAFMKTVEEARALAQTMVDIGVGAGRAMVALLSDMNQPLGYAVGNALEVREAIETLRGDGPADLREHCLTVAAHMVCLGRRDTRPETFQAVQAELTHLLNNGQALAKFRELVEAQGGDVQQVDEPERLPQARYQETLYAEAGGYAAEVNALKVAQATLELGAGRARKTDTIDPAVGVVVHKKVGDSVAKGDPLFTVHANDPDKLARARAVLTEAVVLSQEPQTPPPAFYDTIVAAPA